MREIKFRGKDIDTGEWLYGYLTKHEIAEYGKCHIGTMITRLEGGDYLSVEVDPETIGQYTGLKDKNGVEIYEGDVVRVTRTMGSPFEKMVVEFSKQQCGWRLLIGPQVYHIPTRQQMIVIGNLHTEEGR